MKPNLQHAIERVERPGGSHEGVGREKNKAVRKGRKIEQNEVPKPGPQTGSFAVTLGRTPIVSCHPVK